MSTLDYMPGEFGSGVYEGPYPDLGGGNLEMSSGGGLFEDYLSPLLTTWMDVEKFKIQRDLAYSSLNQPQALETTVRDSNPGAVPYDPRTAAAVAPTGAGPDWNKLAPWLIGGGILLLVLK